jgi:N6-adenosine-specific RNA methylase IME4
LKELIGPMMPDPKNYRALEVFARNMTSGWSAWGDEAMKFNWDGNWTDLKDLG